MLSWVVLAVVFTIQLLLYIPVVLYSHHDSLQDSMETKSTLLTSLYASGSSAATDLSKALLDDTLVGLVVTGDRDHLILDIGETLGFGAPDVALEASGYIWPESVIIETRSGPLTAVMFLSSSQAWLQSLLHASGLLLIAAVVSLAAGSASLLGLHHLYTQRVKRLISALRTSRQNSQGEVPEIIDIDAGVDLNPIAAEFNELIEAQRKSSRQVKVKQQYLEFAAHHDPLTHLPNRLMFEDVLKRTVRDAISRRVQFTVFLVDLDNFKYFNDQYGHLVGDKMVAEVGNRLRTMMRDIDLVARLDGDEFVVIQKEVEDASSAEKIARRIMNVATAPYEYRGFSLKVAVSVGISSFPADVHLRQDATLLGEEIVNNAAVALQEAKTNGKNQYLLFNEKMRSRLTARIRLEQDLKLALQDGQFEVYYQPKINIHTRQCTGAEALVRWRHPVNGFVSPEAFVPVAEETGIIIELGEWILETACELTYELQQKGFAGLSVAVNISAVQFTDGNLLSMVSRALEQSRLRPQALELEITESAVMHDPEEVISSLHELSKFGMKLAIDDFGTGYSSLAYLKRFPVDTLKIDRAFITDISSDNDDVAIVEAVLGLGKHFNMKVVAEGVEDEEQLNFLKSQGCDVAQGYFISKPLSAEQYHSWLERWPYGTQGSTTAANEAIIPAIIKTGT